MDTPTQSAPKLDRPHWGTGKVQAVQQERRPQREITTGNHRSGEFSCGCSACKKHAQGAPCPTAVPPSTPPRIGLCKAPRRRGVFPDGETRGRGARAGAEIWGNARSQDPDASRGTP